MPITVAIRRPLTLGCQGIHEIRPITWSVLLIRARPQIAESYMLSYQYDNFVLEALHYLWAHSSSTRKCGRNLILIEGVQLPAQ